QHKTVNKQFIEELFSRYVSGDSKIKVVEDNPNNTFWVIDTGGRIIYPDDLREAIETYKPAHLRYGLEMRRDIFMDDESKIRLGFASMFEGYNKILLDAPKGIESVLTAAIIPARTGLVRVGFEIASEEKFNIRAGIAAGIFGKKEIALNKEDLPKIFQDKDSYISPKFGITESFRGVVKIPLGTPENGILKIGYAGNLAKTGIRRYGLDPPQNSSLNIAFGANISLNGEKKIDADIKDLPEIFKDKNSHIAEKLAITGVFKGNKRIGLDKPTKEEFTSKVGFSYGIFGKTTINIDGDDLPQEFKEKTSRITAFIGVKTVAKGYKKISVATDKQSKAAFGAGILDVSRGVRRITSAPPEEAVARAGISTLYANNGRRVIPAKLADLPESLRRKIRISQFASEA
ncbi:MAG: hypothetical protein J6I62_10115, partial [Selenomonadaceae bacterium]|nr:hypothetical protein [Selenomonadaceae bacterium]